MIDTHAHIDGADYDSDRDEIIRDTFNSGLEYIIIPSTEPKYFKKIISISEKYENIYFAIGIHPHNSGELNDGSEMIINHIAESHSKCCAIGEIGLDYYYDFNPKDVQISAFRKQIAIAKKLNLPIIVHNRDSDDDLIEILSQEQDGTLKIVLHCFSGNEQLLNKALNLNCVISFTGNITFKKSTLNEIVEKVPLDRIMLETDSPYMTPVPLRGKRNEPKNVKLIAEKIADIKSINIDEVIKMTTLNAKKFFNLAILLLFFIVSTALFAQKPKPAVKEPVEETEMINPFDRGVGAGFQLGTNTIVQSDYWDNVSTDVSYEGIFFYGPTISVEVLDYLTLEATYTYGKNTKLIQSSNNNFGPNIYQVIEFSSLWTANPYSKVSFFASAGVTKFFTTLNQGRITKDGTNLERSKSPFGFNIGIGFRINIPIKGVGVLNPVVEWRLNWNFIKQDGIRYEGVVDNDNNPNTPPIPVYRNVKQNEFFSMPRLGFIFYPEIFKF